jgi:hypothetical protein
MASLLKLSADEKQKLSDSYDAMKLKFEVKLERGLKKLFNQIADDLLILYSATNEILNFDDYLIELEVLLRKSYRETSKFFSEHYEREMQKQQDEGDNSAVLAFIILLRKDISKQIFVDIDKGIKKIVPLHAKEILKTTRKVVVSEIDKTAEIIKLSGGEISSEIVIDSADKGIRERNVARAGTISETEVGSATGLGSNVEDLTLGESIEDAKKNDAILRTFDNEELFEFEAITLTKTWMAILDRVTREAHLDAHGQEVDVFKPFTVGGQLMMQPLDSSLGASLGNIINCRCNSIST